MASFVRASRGARWRLHLDGKGEPLVGNKAVDQELGTGMRGAGAGGVEKGDRGGGEENGGDIQGRKTNRRVGK